MALSLTREEFLIRHAQTKVEFTYELGRRVGPRPAINVPANLEISPDNPFLVKIDLLDVLVLLSDAIVESVVATVYQE